MYMLMCWLGPMYGHVIHFFLFFCLVKLFFSSCLFVFLPLWWIKMNIYVGATTAQNSESFIAKHVILFIYSPTSHSRAVAVQRVQGTGPPATNRVTNEIFLILGTGYPSRWMLWFRAPAVMKKDVLAPQTKFPAAGPGLRSSPAIQRAMYSGRS